MLLLKSGIVENWKQQRRILSASSNPHIIHMNIPYPSLPISILFFFAFHNYLLLLYSTCNTSTAIVLPLLAQTLVQPGLWRKYNAASLLPLFPYTPNRWIFPTLELYSEWIKILFTFADTKSALLTHLHLLHSSISHTYV